MTQSTWKISDAKAHFAEVVQASSDAPQLLYSRGKPEDLGGARSASKKLRPV